MTLKGCQSKKLLAQHHDEENLKQQIKQGNFELKLQEYLKQQTLTQEKKCQR